LEQNLSIALIFDQLSWFLKEIKDMLYFGILRQNFLSQCGSFLRGKATVSFSGVAGSASVLPSLEAHQLCPW
jgi:hypothetical protein